MKIFFSKLTIFSTLIIALHSYSPKIIAQADTTHCYPGLSECVRVKEVVGTTTVIHIYPGIKGSPPGPIL